ncbi:MAG TPA: hypothetical protein PK668_01440 [Myxococcota bacterium]|nr:hypothetical protein [Myxococcota bacterium]HRY96766.1 hypothetical protein [Myxococcota bacterium]HSA21543.1 hypothetical protein [Myxococcota bacterium]
MKPHCLRWTLAAALLLPACAEQLPPVNRVQPYALEKRYFVGEDLQDAADNPEFWTQGTLIDVGYGAAQDGLFTSTYAQPMARIRWEITENLLLGRLAYERIQDSDGKGAGRATNDGVIVVAFPVESHFDIVRAYNPTTGEQLNVLEENSSDRPWYEREYMRVDWSRNMNTDSYDFDTLSMLGVYGGVTYESLDYDVTDPGDPDAPVLDLENGYFDVTNKAFATPQLVDLAYLGWGIDSFPACFLEADFTGGSAPAGSCNPVELTIRQSFRRVDEGDFEPIHWDGQRFQSFGGFTTDRYGFARNYGMADALWYRFLNHHRIWERSHYYQDPEAMTGPVACNTPETTGFGDDPNRDEDADGTADECAAAGAGSRCDIFRQRCTLPYAQREVRALAWYYSDGSDPFYFEPTREAAHQWDVALRQAVVTARYVECQRTGGQGCAGSYPVPTGQQVENEDALNLAREVDDCRARLSASAEDCQALADSLGSARGYSPAVVALAKMPEMVVLCHSPVEAADPEVCGGPADRLPPGLTAAECAEAREGGDELTQQLCAQARHARRGDLRYHQINVIPEPQTPSPWGIMVDSIDPVSGMSVAASINVWSYINDLISQLTLDQIRYLKGELRSVDVTEGRFIEDWAQAAQSAGSHGVLPKLSRAELNQLVAEFSGGTPEQVERGVGGLPDQVQQEVRSANHDIRAVRATVDAPSTHKAVYASRLRAAQGTEFEAALMTPMLQALTGTLGLPLSDAVMNLASPLRGANPAMQREFRQAKEEALARRGACILHPDESIAPVSLPGLADVLEAKFERFNPADPRAVQQVRAERMRQYVARRMHMSVIAHEMGHSVGLRHNFVSSSDALDYRPQYWQLRTRNGQVTTPCQDLTADGDSCVGPRYFDPVTAEERNNLIWMWMHSSIMEYPGDITQDMLGLGVYDFAAVRMLYGDAAPVHADPSFNAGTARGAAMLDKMDSFGGILGIQPTWGGENYHYSEMQNRLELIRDCQNLADPTLFRPANWDEDQDGVWSPLLDGLLVKVDNQWSRCQQQPVDYVDWDQLGMPSVAQAGSSYFGGPSVDPAGRTRVPYGFATDRWADLGNVSVYRHDNGADPYEIFDFLISQQEVNYIFDRFRRGRQTFSVRGAAARTLERYSAKVRDGAKGLSLFRNYYEGIAYDLGYEFSSLWPTAAGWYKENIIASSLAFDHFARTLDRPTPGAHFRRNYSELLFSDNDSWATPGPTLVNIPAGVKGRYDSIVLGGWLVENQLAEGQGEYDSDYTVNAGSYYDKLYTAMLMTESVDNFISDSRMDFVDPRYRAVSLADLFPDGFRRWLGNNLTGDELLKGWRVPAQADGTPDAEFGTKMAPYLGWISWWPSTPQVCFPNGQTTLCSDYTAPTSGALDPRAPAGVAVLDPQVGWEQQKFLIAWTMLYLPENQEQYWLDLLRIWELGADADPGVGNRIELHDPNGKVYVAKTFGKETLLGKPVQRGVAARVLEYANELLVQAYVVSDGPDLDGDGGPDWYLPELSPTTGQPMVKYDPRMQFVNEEGYIVDSRPGCNAGDSSQCDCSSNRACVDLGHYMSVPAYLREALWAYQLGDPSERGIY